MSGQALHEYVTPSFMLKSAKDFGHGYAGVLPAEPHGARFGKPNKGSGFDAQLG